MVSEDCDDVVCSNCGGPTKGFIIVNSITTYHNPYSQDLHQEPWCMTCIVNAGAPSE